MTNSNLLACITGRSAGLALLRPSAVNVYLIGVWLWEGFFTGAGWATFFEAVGGGLTTLFL
jgi:hypothetical protein